MAKTQRSFGHRREKQEESVFGYLFRDYIRNASKRNYPFELTRDQFKSLTKQDCYLCGSPPMNTYRKKTRFEAVVIYNGVDRVDNAKGYTVENCKACCKNCNLAKRGLSLKEFTNHVKKIVTFQKPRKSGPIKTTVKS